MFNLFLIFQEKGFVFHENVNEEVSSNNKKEITNMMEEATKLSDAVTHYASHCIRVNVRFSAIEIL